MLGGSSFQNRLPHKLSRMSRYPMTRMIDTSRYVFNRRCFRSFSVVCGNFDVKTSTTIKNRVGNFSSYTRNDSNKGSIKERKSFDKNAENVHQRRDRDTLRQPNGYAKESSYDQQNRNHVQRSPQQLQINTNKFSDNSRRKVNETRLVDTKNVNNKRNDKLALRKISMVMAQIQSEIKSLSRPMAPIWMIETKSSAMNCQDIISDMTTRREIFFATSRLFDEILIPLTQQSIIQPSGKHRMEFSAIVDNIFRFYHECYIDDNYHMKQHTKRSPSVFDKCIHLLKLLQDHQYEPSHYHCYVAATLAAREGRWIEGAAIYETHIQSALTPTQSSADISTAIGLYIIARASQRRVGRSIVPVDRVMNNVLQLTLVSPQDSDLCTCSFYC
jgi:hypothetical protein